jgi:hypothetical protein
MIGAAASMVGLTRVSSSIATPAASAPSGMPTSPVEHAQAEPIGEVERGGELRARRREALVSESARVDADDVQRGHQHDIR